MTFSLLLYKSPFQPFTDLQWICWRIHWPVEFDLDCRVPHNMDFAEYMFMVQLNMFLCPLYFLENKKLVNPFRKTTDCGVLFVRKQTMSGYCSLCDVSSHWYSVNTQIFCSITRTHSSSKLILHFQILPGPSINSSWFSKLRYSNLITSFPLIGKNTFMKRSIPSSTIWLHSDTVHNRKAV